MKDQQYTALTPNRRPVAVSVRDRRRTRDRLSVGFLLANVKEKAYREGGLDPVPNHLMLALVGKHT